MDKETTEFLKRLYDEIIHHKDKRATFVLQKLVAIAFLFGLGLQESDNYSFTNILFVVPFVSLTLDIFIFAEHYKVKRIGSFLRIYRFASIAERNWEKFVQAHRESGAMVASFVLTILAACASGIAIYMNDTAAYKTPGSLLSAYWLFRGWSWAVMSLLFIVFGSYLLILNHLPSSHLSEGQIKELIAAPGDDNVDQILATLMIALILNTGIAKRELFNLKWSDLSYDDHNLKELKISQYLLTPGRSVPYRNKPEIQKILSKHVEYLKECPKKIFPWRMRFTNHVLKQYPIVVDGSIQTVTYEVLRRTYARLLYADGEDVKAIQQKLGFRNIKKVLGFIGPLEIYREERKQFFVKSEL